MSHSQNGSIDWTTHEEATGEPELPARDAQIIARNILRQGVPKEYLMLLKVPSHTVAVAALINKLGEVMVGINQAQAVAIKESGTTFSESFISCGKTVNFLDVISIKFKVTQERGRPVIAEMARQLKVSESTLRTYYKKWNLA